MKITNLLLRHVDFLAPFRVCPRNVSETSGVDYSLSHLDAGAAYAAEFAKRRGRALTWAFEQGAIDSIMDSKQATTYLDFAAGTGRVAVYMRRFCPQVSMIDASSSMLAIAARSLPDAKVVCKDFRSAPAEAFTSRFDVVTAFRFFPNAQPALQEAAMRFIARALRPGGVLICNNHRNFWSIPYVGGRLLCLTRATQGMTHRRMLQLGTAAGLRLIATRSYGVVPQNEVASVLPWFLAGTVDRIIQSRWGSGHRLGHSVVYHFEKPEKQSHAC